MRRTLLVFIFSLGLSACGGVEEAAEAQAPESGPSALAWCELSDPRCSEVRDKLCHPYTTTYCCENERITCTCSVARNKWFCPAAVQVE